MGWDGLQRCLANARRHQAVACRRDGGCWQQQEVLCGFPKRDTHFPASATAQLPPAWEVEAAGLWGWS